MRRRGMADLKNGSVLIVVLVMTFILSMIVMSLATQSKMEAKITKVARLRRRAEGLSQSGMAVARMLLIKQGEVSDSATEEETADDRWYEPASRLKDGLPVTGLKEGLGDGDIILDIVPEPALLNVNKLHVDDWERLLEVGGIPEDYWPELIDSFFDWVDTDAKPRADGGESEDYYTTLEEPYLAKNGPLDTVGELLLVKGFTKAIVYGGRLNSEDTDEEGAYVSGLADMLTTYGDGKVNVNAASSRVLMTLPGVDDVVAGAIIEEREGWLSEAGEDEDHSFESVGGFMSRIPGLEPGVKTRVTTRSQFFRINSVGKIGRVTRRIWAIVEQKGQEMIVLRWREKP